MRGMVVLLRLSLTCPVSRRLHSSRLSNLGPLHSFPPISSLHNPMNATASKTPFLSPALGTILFMCFSVFFSLYFSFTVRSKYPLSTPTECKQFQHVKGTTVNLKLLEY